MGVRHERCSRRARHCDLFEQILDFSADNVGGGLRGRRRVPLDLQSRRPEAMTSLLSAKSERIVIIALLTLAAVLRVTAAVVLPDQSSALVDALAYRELAVRLWSDGQIAGYYQMPLYP